MFTGLVEATGTVVSLEKRGEQARLTLSLPFGDALAIGDSVAVNGVCLTATPLGQGRASFDVLTQTLQVTSLGDLQRGSLVNLERALRMGDRLGGHFVLGHVDDTAPIVRMEENGHDHIITVALPPDIARLCVDKGSIAIDGISLTIARLSDAGEATFCIIPHTWSQTRLHTLCAGQRVNIEADMLAKHVARLMRL